ncbi:MAG: ABC transporter ATP-binding protein [Tyzzerella sp.]|nr:ABC transporter ATP-binding protein [Tyzzerella sp.]
MERPKYHLLQNIGYMIQAAWEMRKSVLGILIITSILTVANSTTELLVVPAILNKVETGASISELLIIILIFTIILLLLTSTKTYVEANTMFGQLEVQAGMLWRVCHKSVTTSYPNMEDKVIGEKCDKAADATLRHTREFWMNISLLLTNLLGFCVYLFMVSSLKPILLVVIIATTIIGYFANIYFNEWYFRHREEQARYTRQMGYSNRIAAEMDWAKDIRLFGMQEWLNDVYTRTLAVFDAFIMRGQIMCFMANVVDAVLTILRNGIAYAYLIALTLRGGLSASEFLLYFSAVTGFTAWITGILKSVTELRKNSNELSTMREFLEVPEVFRFEDGVPLNVTDIEKCEIELKDVSFRYPNAEEDTLSHINLTIHPGERIAIVGLNGAGKTTLVKLICGFYDPTEGQVLLNGQDIRQYNRRDYYALFSAVFQEFQMLPSTVADNVAQDVIADEERVKECLAKAGLLEKIEGLPKGIYNHVSKEVYDDGIDFSGGELQRLMLARALYKEAKMLVLDEPTAALDAIAEHEMYLKYKEMTEGNSSVYISHRLASTRFCDRIILLADGQIAEEGTHDSLLVANGKYAELFQVQSKYYQEGELLHESVI